MSMWICIGGCVATDLKTKDSPPEAINCRLLLSWGRGGACEPCPHPCCSVDWLDFVQVTMQQTACIALLSSRWLLHSFLHFLHLQALAMGGGKRATQG